MKVWNKCGNMFTSEIGIVEEWLSEFKVIVTLLIQQFYSRQNFSAFFIFYVTSMLKHCGKGMLYCIIVGAINAP